MRRSAIFMPVFALLAGASGYYLRMLELWEVFDERTGLPRRGAGVTHALIILTLTFLLLVLLFSLIAKTQYDSQSGFENAFGTESFAYPTMFIMIGIVWLGATVIHFFNLRSQGAMSFSALCFVCLSALSSISMPLFALEVYQDPRRISKFALSVVPTLFMCFWLILLYRQNATNPVLLSYCYQCLAIISTSLSFYFTAGFVYGRPAPGKAIMALLAAIYFCFVTLADKHPGSIKLIIVAIIAANVIYSTMLIRNLQRKFV